MPELPEVETIRKGAKDKLIGKKISDIEIREPKIFIGEKKNVIGAKIIDVRRVAKILEIVLDNGNSIIIHLKLTGQLIYRKTENPASLKLRRASSEQKTDYTRIIYTFSDGSRLYFNDSRKFGWNRVVKTSEVEKILGPDKFGPEPGQKEFTIDYLKKFFAKTGKPIKLVLMDQSKIGGIGNIYANDGLYWAGIMPARPAKSLSTVEISKLKSAIEKVINLGIKYGGSSENTYVNIEGKQGRYMDYAAVYQQKLDPKGHQLKKIQLGGRGTFYCGKCQK